MPVQEDMKGMRLLARKQNNVNPEISPKNSLNELTGREWIQATCSVMYQRGLGADHRDTKYEIQHPAPFSFQDAGRLVRFFTKQNEKVLDPFSGVASTLKACVLLNRRGVGIELNEKWVRLGRERLRAETPCPDGQKVVMGDSRRIMKTMAGESFDYVITSPPYWNILSKDTHENKRKGRRTEGLDTSYGKSCDDLGNISDYSEFLHELSACFSECYRVLRDGRYATLIVSDFRDGAELVPFHSHVTDMCRGIGFALQGIGVLVQQSKRLYPYGYPYVYVPNIHHQYVLTFRKPNREAHR